MDQVLRPDFSSEASRLRQLRMKNNPLAVHRSATAAPPSAFQAARTAHSGCTARHDTDGIKLEIAPPG
jgi:hypothetical protein